MNSSQLKCLKTDNIFSRLILILEKFQQRIFDVRAQYGENRNQLCFWKKNTCGGVTVFFSLLSPNIQCHHSKVNDLFDLLTCLTAFHYFKTFHNFFFFFFSLISSDSNRWLNFFEVKTVKIYHNIVRL